MYRDVLVPLDGSTFSERALAYALPIVRRSGGTVRLLLVHEPIARYAVEIAPTRLIDRWEDQQREREVRYLERRAMDLRALGVDASAEVIEGHPADEVVRRADKDTDLLVMSMQGRGGADRFRASTVADSVVRRVRLPVILVPRKTPDHAVAADALAVQGFDPREATVKHVIAATDGSPSARAAVQHAGHLAHVFDARLTIIRVVAPTGPAPMAVPQFTVPEHRAVPGAEEPGPETGPTKEPGTGHGALPDPDLGALAADDLGALVDLPRFRRPVRASQAARRILAARADMRGDFLAIGTHRRRGLVRAALGSVTDQVLRGSTVPVLIVNLPRRSPDRGEPPDHKERTSPS